MRPARCWRRAPSPPHVRGGRPRVSILHFRAARPPCGSETASLTSDGRERDAMAQLKFVVLDVEDLAVVSALLQDAVLKVRDVLWRPQENRLVLALSRFDWESAQVQQFRRRLCALRFERVLSCKCKHVNPAGKDAVLN